MPRINNWMPVGVGDCIALLGKIEGHPNPDVGRADLSLTSPIVGRIGGVVVTRSGTMYELGDVEAGELEMFPNTREHLLNGLKEFSDEEE